ncbi:EscU/YscU/HrcU family type III secretion system export apparatus switch protein [Pseudoalteromonas holothuriae]|nr:MULTISPECIES: EscU/YscU/HrcU family type III secretion system export apparatus switch protein [unclassified Pseudoalteromonas]
MSQDQDKSEKPTPQKLKEAKGRGQVSKSQELNLLVTCIVFLSVFTMLFDSISMQFISLLKRIFLISSDFSFTSESLVTLFRFVSMEMLYIFVPLIGFVMLFGVFSNVFQTGFVLSSFPITPDFKKINPASGLKKIFSKKTVFELIKSVFKLLAFTLVIYFSSSTLIEYAYELMISPVSILPSIWLNMLIKVGIYFILLSAPFVLFDIIFNRWDFMKNMMMSRKEVKDDHKKREGDPEVKSKQKQIQQELLQKSAALSQVKDSDIVIVNPTHIAVALKYDKLTMIAPVVMAVGKGELAGKIRSQARRYSVPTIQNKPLARKLYKETRLNKPVPAHCFDDLAPIFRWLLGIK